MTLDDYGDAAAAGGAPGSADKSDDRARLDGHDIASELLDDWRIMFDQLRAVFTTADFASALVVVDEIGAAAEAADHHPDLTLAWGRIDVRLSSHDVGGVTMRDVRLAREISDIAGRRGAKSEPGRLAVLEIALDTADQDAIRPFWAALLGYDEEESTGEVFDPTGTGPTLWFQQTEPDGETPAQRFHLDVRVPPEVAEQRVQAALDAGGTLVSDERAPRFWVLADADDNRACVTTWLGRS